MTTANGKRPVRLADIATATGESIELPSGRVVDVHIIDGFGAQLRKEYLETAEPTLLWELVARLLPDASPAEVSELRQPQAWAVVTVAAGLADEMEAAIHAQIAARSPDPAAEPGTISETVEGNASAPRTTAPEGSSPPIPSPTP